MIANLKNIVPQTQLTTIYANELRLTYRKAIELQEPEFHCLNSSKKIAGFLRSIWDKEDLTIRESFYLLCFSSRMDLVGFQKISDGGLDAVMVDSRLIFSTALLCRSSSIVIAHNHPSGTLYPSEADRILTSKIREAGQLLDIKLSDHIILTDNGYYSFTDEGAL
ncbi:JAB domain-containing protein [Sphingobacterium siyangense]|uniref:JAB domain-containing protein n=1 Tax=Sphingobacterium siyangense TaxID=459529 RepID=UPI00289F28A7|nr:JAB domain-containing protein [Sphingobacterium siyangense]